MPLPEEDVCRELASISDVGSFEPLDRESSSPEVPFHLRLEERLYGVVVRHVTLFLEVDKEVGKAPNLLREALEQALLTTRFPGPTV